MQTVTGGCHCGQVRFETTADLSQVIACNCSICTRRGFLWSFVPPDRFKLRSGEDSLTEYRFNKKVIQHLFCADCGVESFARGVAPDGKPMVAINVRCLDGIDPATLKTAPFDGRSL
ncbi:MAG: GFA family protein [Pseudorhodoplanes sp.]